MFITTFQTPSVGNQHTSFKVKSSTVFGSRRETNWDLQLNQLKNLQWDQVSCSDTFLLKISNTEIMNLLLQFPHRRKVLEITNTMSVWISFLNCAVNGK